MTKKDNPDGTRKWIIVLIVGIIALAAGIAVFLLDNNVKENYTGNVLATVTGYEEEEEYNSSTETYITVYYPIMKYSVDGTEITARYSQCFSYPRYEIGDAVELCYLPENPTKFSITEDNRGTVTVLWEIPVGIILIIMAIYKLKKAGKEEQLQ